MPVDVLHLHGFKCAGTTFQWTLEANYPGQVAYVESGGEGERLPWQAIQGSERLGRARAITSHLVTLPPPGAGLASMHVVFVREPVARLLSVWRFAHAHWQPGTSRESLLGFLSRSSGGVVANYQTRLLSPQDHGGWRARQGWQLRPELIDLDRPDVFVGVVERFEESLLALTLRMESLGLPFNPVYPGVLNATEPSPDDSGAALIRNSFPALVELDTVLYERVDAQLSAFLARHPGRTLAEFQRDFTAPGLVPPLPEEWVFLDA